MMNQTQKSDQVFKKTKWNKKQKDLVFYVLMLAFPVTQFIIFYLGVNFNSILLAFRKYNPLNGQYSFVGLENFNKVIQDLLTQSLFKTAIQNTLTAFVFCIFFGITLGLVFSYYIYKRFFGHKFFKVMLFLPSIVSSLVMVTIFMQFVESGIPNILNQLFGLKVMGFLANSETTFITIMIYNIWIGFGVSVLLYVGAMDSINESTIEAAKIDGVNKFQEFFHIILPLIWPTFTQFVVVAVGAIFMNQLNLFAFYGQGAEIRLYTIGYYLYKETLISSNVNMPYLATLGIILTMITIPITMIIRYLLQKFGPSVD